jgi:hypothetical protein
VRIHFRLHELTILCATSREIIAVFKIMDGRIRMIDNIGLMEDGITTSGFTD